LFSLVSIDLTGKDFLLSPSVLKQVKEESRNWFAKELQFLKMVDKSNYIVLFFDEFYGKIEKGMRDVYAFLGKGIKEGTPLVGYFKQQEEAQRSHRPTHTDDRHFTDDEITQTFPDLPSILRSM